MFSQYYRPITNILNQFEPDKPGNQEDYLLTEICTKSENTEDISGKCLRMPRLFKNWFPNEESPRPSTTSSTESQPYDISAKNVAIGYGVEDYQDANLNRTGAQKVIVNT